MEFFGQFKTIFNTGKNIFDIRIKNFNGSLAAFRIFI